jgi:hypothetical protein
MYQIFLEEGKATEVAKVYRTPKKRPTDDCLTSPGTKRKEE